MLSALCHHFYPPHNKACNGDENFTPLLANNSNNGIPSYKTSHFDNILQTQRHTELLKKIENNHISIKGVQEQCQKLENAMNTHLRTAAEIESVCAKIVHAQIAAQHEFGKFHLQCLVLYFW